jgi:small subunit ribosomal protein S20e
MSGYVADGKKDYDAAGVPAAKSHKIRITLTSKKVKELEKGAPRTFCISSAIVC